MTSFMDEPLRHQVDRGKLAHVLPASVNSDSAFFSFSALSVSYNCEWGGRSLDDRPRCDDACQLLFCAPH